MAPEGNVSGEDPAFHFDAQSEFYRDVRPGYPDKLFADVARFLKAGPHYSFLEIGAGSGLATDQIIRFWQPNLTLIEPGSSFSRLLREKYAGRPNIHIIQDTFEYVPLEDNGFDAVFAATSFHWLNREVKYAKAHRVLTENGLLVLFWNSYAIAGTDRFAEIQEIYSKYTGSAPVKDIRKRQKEKMEKRRNEIYESGLFYPVFHRITESVKPFTAENYLKLLKTFPDHAAFPVSFFDEIAALISESGSAIDVRIVLNIEIARKITSTLRT